MFHSITGGDNWGFELRLNIFINNFLFPFPEDSGTNRKQKQAARSKPIRADVDKIINNSPSTTFKYLPTRVGAGKISLEAQVYDYHFKSKRISFWRCTKQDCPAKVITRAMEAWILNDKHNH